METKLAISTRAKATEAMRLKRLRAKSGLVFLVDVMHHALTVLEQEDRQVCAVAARFDEVIVDEAQDTSYGRLRRSFVLVGDSSS